MDEMIADSAEIRFECSQCGQSLSVDSSGAGISTNCPACESPVVVPQPGSIHDRHYGESAPAGPGRPVFAPDAAGELRAELAEARQRNEELELGLSSARREAGRRQQELKKATGAAQAGREQMSGDLAESRKRAATAETQLGEAREKISQIEAALAAAEENRVQWADAFAQMTARAEAHEAQLSAQEAGLAEAQAQLAESTQALAAARAETAVWQAENAAYRQQLEAAQAGLADAAAVRAALAEVQENLATAERTLEAAGEDRRSLASRCAALREEADTLRHDLSEIHTGRELLDLRARFKTLETDHERATAALGRSVAEAEALAASGQQLRTELAGLRTRADEAERRAEAASESALSKDNEVLRGIIARQNPVLEASFAELQRLRRARLGLRILYALVGLALIGLAAFAIGSLPAEAQTFLHDWFGF